LNPIYILSYISSFSVLVPAAVSIIKWKSLNHVLRLFSLYLVITALKESVCVYLALQSRHNVQVYNVAAILEYLIYFYLFYTEFTEKAFKRATMAMLAAVCVVYLADIIFINGIKGNNVYTSSIGAISITVLSLVYFYQLMIKTEHTSLTSVPMFWISTGLIFYYAGTTVLYGFADHYEALPAEQRAFLWRINSVLNIMLNVLFTIAILCKPSKKEMN